MMDWEEITAKTVNDAITEASIRLEVTSDMIEYEVIEEEKNGILGLGLFSRPARIRARKKQEQVKQDKAVVKTKQAESIKETKVEVAEKTSSMVNIEQVAVNFLENVFKVMGIQAELSVNYKEAEGTIEINMEGNDMGILIGKRGQTLDSLQYLVSLVVNKESNCYLKVKLDTENYRERRRETLENLAKNISYKVKRTKRAVSLEPMNPYERRIIHSALQSDRYVETHSEGEEPYRRVVVTLKKNFRDYNKDYNRNNHGKSYNRNNDYKKNYEKNEYASNKKVEAQTEE